jgi:glycosyltransferase involved in cell wall biosynthesis
MAKKITVIMPAYNSGLYIKEAIDSILNQSFFDFELLIIDDGSTDNTVKIIKSYTDKRIRLVQNEKNFGITKTRNRGLKENKSDYLAFLDSDDMALPHRLEKQLNFLEKNTDFGMVGSYVKTIDSAGKLTGVAWKNNLPPEKISSILLFRNYFTQSAIMIRKEAIPEEGYGPFEPTEDFDLWIKISQKWKVWNLPDYLVKYRIHEKGASKTKMDAQNKSLNFILINQLENLKIKPTIEELYIHRINGKYEGDNIINFLSKREMWLLKLLGANNKIGYLDKKNFSEFMSWWWLQGCASNASIGLIAWKKFWLSPLSKNIGWVGKKEITKFFIKCLIRK